MFYFIQNGLYCSNSAIIPSGAEEISKQEYIEHITSQNEFQKNAEIYISEINKGVISIDDVPSEYMDYVEYIINNTPQNDYGISDETYNNIIDDYTANITKEVANSGY